MAGKKRPKVGIGVLVLKDGKVLLSKRKGAHGKSGKPKVLEPHRSESWGWYDLNNLPQPLFEVEHHTFEALKTGKNFFDS